jgi:large repetitive protein
MVRHALLAMGLTALAPVAAQASTGCTAINAGALNHQVVYSAGAPAAGTTAAASYSTGTYHMSRSSAAWTDPFDPAMNYVPSNATFYTFDAGDQIVVTGNFTATSGTELRLRLRIGSGTGSASNVVSILRSTSGTESTAAYTLPAGTNAVGLTTGRFSGASGTIVASVTCTPAVSAPTLNSFTFGSIVAYNPGGASATSIDVATGGSATNAPTSYAVSSATTNGGGTVSITNAGVASYTPRVGYRGNDTFIATATNSGGTSPPATVTVLVGNPTITAAISGTGARVGAALSGYAVTPAAGNAPYSCVLNSGSAALPGGVTLGANCALTGTPTTAGTYSFNVDITDSSVTGTNGATAQPFTQTNVPLTGFVIAQEMPAVTSVSPVAGPTGGGTSVTITGTGFSAAPATGAVKFGAANATYTVNSNTQITATSPANSAGTYDIRVTTPGGTSATSAADQFTYITAPTVTSISPTNGPIGGGMTVVITGTGFAAANPTGAVKFGAANAFYTINSNTQITATSPANSAGTYDITVTTPGGTSATSAADQYTYVAAPTVTSVSPTAGPTSGGTTVTITGSGFSAAPGTGAVKFGATNASYTINSNTQITATSPARPAGTYDITVTTPGGTSATSAADQFTFVAAPVASSHTAAAVAYNAANVNFSVAGHATNSPTSFAVGSATTAQGGSVSVDSAGLVTYSAPTGFRGNDSFVFTATNLGGTSAPATVTVPVSNPTLSFSLAGGSGTRGQALSGVQINTTGGRAPYNCSTVPASGSLPAGTAINADCTITGTPAASGTFNFTATVTDSSLGTGPFSQTTGALSLTIAAPNLALSPGAGALPGATAGVSYSQLFSTSGGTSPYTYAVTAGALPPGITLSSGSLSGIPTAVGTFNFTLRATDAATVGSGGPYTVSNAYSITVSPPAITLAPPTLANGTIGGAYSASVTANGGTSGYTYAITAGSAPPGITMNAGGTFSGTPTGAGTYNFTITATDSTTGPGAPYSGSQAYSITIVAPTITVNPTTLTNATIGTAYSGSVTATGGTGGYSYAVTAGALPAGVTLSPTGSFSGTPTAAGSFNFTVTATDSSTGTGAPFTGNRPYTLTVTAPTVVVSPTTLPAPTAGVAYSQTVTASGGTAGYTFAITSGALPAGLSLDPGGTVTGTATAGGTFTFTITATDSSTGTGAPFTGSQSYTFTVDAPTITVSPASLPNGRAGTAYSQSITAIGGNGTHSFAVTAGALPPGWTLSSTGALSGTATAVGTFNFTITATDQSTGAGAPFTGFRSYTVNVFSPNFTLTPPTLSATVGQAYSGNFVAGGGTAPYTYTRMAGTLPTGMTLNTDGTLSGTPTASGTFNFTVIARDTTTGPGSPFGVGSGYTFTVAPAVMSIDPTTLPNGAVGTSYGQMITATNGVAPYSFAVTAGALPPGVILTGGTLAGTPTAGGTFNFTITATDSSGGGGPATASRPYTLVIAAPTITLAPTTLPSATPGTAYSQMIAASGGTAGYTYAISAGALPPGLALSAGGAVSGTPTAAGSFSFTVRATDSSTGTGAPYTGNQVYTLTVGAPTVTVTTATVPAATIAAAYSQTLAASGGVGPYSYAVTAGALPAGVTLSTGGVLSGTPTAGGTFNFTVTATDSSGGSGPFSGSRALSLTVNAPTIVVSPASLPNPAVGTSYNQTVTASGGTAGYTYAVTTGALPAGMALSPAGVVSGTPTSGGTFNFTVTATDSSTGAGPYTGSRAYSVTVGAPSLTLNPASLANPAIGAAYSESVSATGGTAPYSYGVTAGSLPAGITLSAGGALSGTPTAGGTFNFTITATDSSSGVGAPFTISRAYALTVAAPSVTIAPTSLPNGQMEAAYSQTLTAAGGTAPYSYAVTTGAVPAGTTLSPGGVLSGTPTVHGTFNFTVTATDSSTGAGPYGGARAYSLVIAPPNAPVAGPVSTTVPYNSSANTVTPVLSGGTASSLTVASAPGHGTATVVGMTIQYTPAAGYFGADSFTYTATNAGGTSAPATVSMTVATPPAPTVADRSGIAVPYASSGTAIDLTSSITGVHTSIAVATAPAHGTATVAGNVVTYTPSATHFGADSFTYTATGPGGTSAPATVSLTVATPPAPTVANRSGVAVAYNSPGTAIDLTSSITGVHTSIAITTAPTHGTATMSGNVVNYVPTAGYYGADSFAYTATGPGGTSTPATVGLVVANPPAPVTAPGTGTVTGNTTLTNNTVAVDLSALVTGVHSSIQIANQPAHGTVTLSAGAPYLATYKPAVNYAGTDSFTFVAVGPGGTSTPGTVTITVVGQTPVALPKTAATGDGQMVSVMLTDGATGGPFTGANVVSVSPAGSVATTIVAAGNGTYRLDATPSNRFGGTIVVTYTLSNAFGASAPATVTLTVQARPDPRNDPVVGAISDAQAETARRFARAQVSNFMRRAEQLHSDGGGSGSAMGITLSSRDSTGVMNQFDDSSWGLTITDRMRRSSEDPAIGRVANDPRSPFSRVDRLGDGRMLATSGGALADAQPRLGVGKTDEAEAPGSGFLDEDGKRRNGSVALWAGGAIEIGTRNETTDRSKITATTAGLSGGADIKLADGIVVGVGGGYGNDLSRIGTAAQVRGTSSLFAAYASILPVDGFFIDGMLGRGQLDFTTRRFVTAVNAEARGSRDGSYTVAALSLGIDRGDGPLQWSLYGRGEYLDADLDAYAESGAGRYNLRFDAREVRSVVGTIGGRIQYRQKVSFGSITPRLRAEWNHEFADIDPQWLDYADIPGAAFYALPGNGWSREQIQLNLGTRFDLLASRWSLDFETGWRGGQGGQAGTLQLRVSRRF